MRKWHVFDQFDYMAGDFDTAAEASVEADKLAQRGFERLEIRHMTAEELAAYLKGDSAYQALINA